MEPNARSSAASMPRGGIGRKTDRAIDETAKMHPQITSPFRCGAYGASMRAWYYGASAHTLEILVRVIGVEGQ
jgi:hypothetical protein